MNSLLLKQDIFAHIYNTDTHNPMGTKILTMFFCSLALAKHDGFPTSACKFITFMTLDIADAC